MDKQELRNQIDWLEWELYYQRARHGHNSSQANAIRAELTPLHNQLDKINGFK